MKSRFFKILICFTLIVSLVFGEASMVFATETEDKYKDWDVAKVELESYTLSSGNNYSYTGSAIKPSISSMTVNVTYKNPEDETEETVTKKITNTSGIEKTYKNNVSFGTGYVIATVEGSAVEMPFNIILGRINSIKAQSTSNTTIKISWSKVTGAAGYVVYRSKSANSGFSAIKTITGGGTTSLSNTKLKFRNTYYYKVCPYRVKDGKKLYGYYSSTVKCTAKPATPASVKVKRNTYNSLKITWSKVPDATGYKVYRSESLNGTYKRIATLKGAKKVSYKDKRKSCGKTYYYKVKAYKTVNFKKYHGTSTSAVSGRTTPSGTSFTNETMSWYSSVTLKWKKSAGASGYVIYRSTKPDSGYTAIKTITSGKTLKYVNSSLSSTTKYYYKVRPYVNVNGTKVYGTYSKAYTKFVISEKLAILINKYEGTRYRFGGNTPKGWDCSGFVQWATKFLFGKKIPRTAGAQARGGKYVNKSKMSTWQPGDVLVYKRNGGGVSHVGMYIGGGMMMHALNSRYDTVIQGVSYYEKWDRGNYLAAVRRYK